MTKKIFFVGIKGVGMTPLAIIAKQSGLQVFGSDTEQTFITDTALTKNNIPVHKSFTKDPIDELLNDCSKENVLVVTTGAHGGFDNPQVKYAKEKGIKVLSQGQALGQFMLGKFINKTPQKSISIAGSHGKTTTTAMVAVTLEKLGKDPSYVIGTGSITGLDFPGHLGKGEYFIAEADEYVSEPVHDKTPKLLYHNPYAAIITNIDFDHPDVYENIDQVIDTFKSFSQKVKKGPLVVFGDDSNTKSISQENTVTYGQKDTNTYVVKNIAVTSSKTSFEIFKQDKKIETFSISVPGEHNALNASGVIAFLLEEGFKPEDIKNSILSFTGTKRRLEKIGETKRGSYVFDDYAHHPQEIKTTINALKKAYPSKKIIAIFQSHTYSRTLALHKEFAQSFKNVDELVLLPIFSSAREKNSAKLSSEEYREPFEKTCSTVVFKSTKESVIEYIQEKKHEDSVILTIGAGDIYQIAQTLANS